MSSLLTPAVVWSSKLKFAQKFAVIMVMAIVPLLIISFLTYQRLATTINASENKLSGLEALAPLQQLLSTLPQQHSLSVRLKASGQKGSGELTQLQQRLQTNFGGLQALPKSMMLNDQQLASAGKQWQSLKRTTTSLDLADNQAQHQMLMQTLSVLLTTGGTRSQLLLDQSALNHLLVKLNLQQLHQLLAVSHQLYAAALSITIQGQFSPDTYLSLQSNYQAVLAAHEQMQVAQAMLSEFTAYQDSALSEQLAQLVTALKQVQQQIKRSMLDADELAINTSQVEQIFNAVFTAAKASQTESLALLSQALSTRLSDEKFERNLIVGLMVAAVVFTIYLILAIYTSLQQGLKSLSCHADAMSHGDFSQTLKINAGDEIGDIGNDFEHMRQEVASLVTQVLSSLQQLLQASASLHHNMQASHDAVNGQQQETDNLAASIQELGATVDDVAGNTQSAATTAQEAQVLAQQGQSRVAAAGKEIHQLAQEVELANTTISSLHQDSENIGGVLDVIKGIAEQTNLLALNAAIEAARAGEQGRGFAVVADEVRSLAVKTQDSTEEIQRMIEVLQKGTQDAVAVMQRGFSIANEGVERANEAGEALEHINQSVDDIFHKSQGIAGATQQQSQLSSEILSNTQNIRDQAGNLLTQSDAASALSVEQERLANELNQLVSRFKV